MFVDTLGTCDEEAMLNWFGRIPARVKTLLVITGGLMSTFSGRLPDEFQDIGLYAGLAVGAVALVGLQLHLAQTWRGGRKVGAQDVLFVALVGIALCALLGIGAIIWQYNSPADATATGHDAPSLQMTDGDLNTNARAPDDNQAAQKVSEPRYTPEEIIEILRMLAKLQKINVNDLGAELDQVVDIYSPWLAGRPGLDLKAADSAIAQIAVAEKGLQRIYDSLFVDFKAEYEMYWDIPLKIINRKNPDGRDPIRALQESLEKMSLKLQTFKAVEQNSLEKQSASLMELVHPYFVDVNMKYKALRTWSTENNGLINEQIRKFRAK